MDEEVKDDEGGWVTVVVVALNSTGCTVSVASPARHIPRGPIPRALFIRSINPSYRPHPTVPHALAPIGRHYDLTPTRSRGFMAARDPNPPRLWRIADFPSLRLVINIEFFPAGEATVRRDARCVVLLRGAPGTLARGGARGGVVPAAVCRWAPRGHQHWWGAEDARANLLRAGLQTTVHSSPPATFFPHRAPPRRPDDETSLPEGSGIRPVML